MSSALKKNGSSGKNALSVLVGPGNTKGPQEKIRKLYHYSFSLSQFAIAARQITIRQNCPSSSFV
jgi:hypothetical protein